MTPLPYVISTVAFRNHSLLEAIDAARELGYSRLEIWQRHLFETPESDWPGIARKLRECGMSAPVVAPFLSFTKGPARLLETHEAARKSLQIAAHLGSSRFRTFTDVGPDGLGSAEASAEQWKTASGEIAALCRDNPRLLFVVETHPHTLADGIDSTERLLNAVNEPNFRLNLQPIVPFLDAGFLGVVGRFFPKIAHMHWQQMKPDGGMGYLHEAGRVDFPALVEFLNQRQYAGTVTIEYCWPGARVDMMRNDVDFLRALPPLHQP